jgi:hypothetical protein
MTWIDWTLIGVIVVCGLPVLLSDRWGNFIGTHNWKVSRRLDKEDRRR